MSQSPLYIAYQEVILDGNSYYRMRAYADTPSLLGDAQVVGLMHVIVVRDPPPGELEEVLSVFREVGVVVTKSM